MDSTKTTDDFFDFLGSIAKQYLTDLGTDDFESFDKDFKYEPCDMTGCSTATMNKLIKFARSE